MYLQVCLEEQRGTRLVKSSGRILGVEKEASLQNAGKVRGMRAVSAVHGEDALEHRRNSQLAREERNIAKGNFGKNGSNRVSVEGH